MISKIHSLYSVNLVAEAVFLLKLWHHRLFLTLHCNLALVTFLIAPISRLSSLKYDINELQNFATEMFSSVLTSSDRDGTGAMAVVTYDATGALVMTVMHAGVADRKHLVNASVILGRKNRSVYHAAVNVKPQVSVT